MRAKILYVYHVSQIGGGSYTLLNIIKELDREKFQPYVILREKGPLSEELHKLGVEVYFLSRIRTVPYNKSIWRIESLKNIVNILLSINEYRRILDIVQPDIVHVNSMMLYPYLICPFKKQIKTIVHIREHWQNGEHRIQRRLANIIIKNCADSVFAINSFSAAMLDNIVSKTHIIYDWIDMDSRYVYMPLSECLNENIDNKKIFLFTGGEQSIKGIHQVLRAFSDCVLDDNARLLILGGMTDNIPQFLLDATQNDNRIKLLPPTYNITHILQQSYCVLSYFTIPHANLALAESIITKTPVLAAYTPESMEYSCNGKYAQLYNLNNYEEFCKQLQSIETWIDKLRFQLENGANIIKTMFETKRNSLIIENVYMNMLYRN